MTSHTIPCTDPLHTYVDADLPAGRRLPSARLTVATEGARFLAALLMKHGADADLEGGNRLTACPNWMHGVGAALAAVVDSIESAHAELLDNAGSDGRRERGQ